MQVAAQATLDVAGNVTLRKRLRSRERGQSVKKKKERERKRRKRNRIGGKEEERREVYSH